MPRKTKGGDETTPAPSTSGPGILDSITNTLKKGVQTVQDATGMNKAADTLDKVADVDTSKVSQTIGTAPESGTTTTGGRRRRTMKKGKKSKKTMRRKH